MQNWKKYFQPVASKDKELVAYCFIGQTASVVYLAGREPATAWSYTMGLRRSGADWEPADGNNQEIIII